MWIFFTEEILQAQFWHWNHSQKKKKKFMDVQIINKLTF